MSQRIGSIVVVGSSAGSRAPRSCALAPRLRFAHWPAGVGCPLGLFVAGLVASVGGWLPVAGMDELPGVWTAGPVPA
jgi:hypothetical protein